MMTRGAVPGGARVGEACRPMLGRPGMGPSRLNDKLSEA
jgi:hypothetical protein